MTLVTLNTSATAATDEDAPEAIALTDIPSHVELEMTSKAVKSENYRPQWVGALDEARTVRVKAYIPASIGIEGGEVQLRTKDAERKALDHGETRYVWNDEEQNVLVKAFVPTSKDVKVKRFTLTF